ncbi:MAG TPA: peptidylprolyl isomerase [Gemmatimonadales bacterium]|nr:peptidylprolyl isomerase [Gemmatimonadales bacterium]
MAALAAVVALWPQPGAAQEEARVTEELARLLAAADTRVYDATLFAAALRDTDPFVRRQAALAAGRIGDSAAVGPLIAALADPAPPVRATAAFALGLLKPRRAVAPLAALARVEPEAITAIAKIGGDEAAAALRGLLENRAPPPPPTALLEAWRLGTGGAPVAQLLAFVHDPDAGRRRPAVYSVARLRAARGAASLVDALGDADAGVRVVALRGLSRTLTDSATLDARDVARRISALVTDRDPHIRVNALRALASFRDAGLAAVVLPLLADGDVNVVVQAETTLGVLGGMRAAAALSERLTSPTFALRRQAAIALAQADSAAGVAAAAALARETDWRWRSVAAEAFGAARDRAGLEAELADPDGRVVAQALQTLGRIVPDSDARAASLARDLVGHADAAVRSVAADLIARHPAVTDVDRLRDAYLRAAQDSFNDARLSAVTALAAIAGTGPDGRAAVASGFVARVPRADDYLVRRLAVEKLPDAAVAWGPVAPIATGRAPDEYRALVRRYLLPARHGHAAPRVTIETDRGRLVVELLPADAPLTVAAFLDLVDRRYFDGSRWHRVVPNFVVQDGDPRGDGWGGPAFVLRDEINPVRYESGTVGMALSGPDTGGSQFFITHSPQPHLDGTYTVFGRVVGGRDVLERISLGEGIRSVHR